MHAPQKDSLRTVSKDALPNAVQAPVIDSSKQRDVFDIIDKILKIKDATKKREHPKKANFSIIPTVGYSLSTGALADLSGNVAFYTDASHQQNLSALYEDIIYDTNSQIVALLRGEIWGKKNETKIVVDLRWERFPEDTYGLGTFTTDAKTDPITFEYQRTYITYFKKLIGDNYIGLGYNLDYHYGISEKGNMDGTESDFKKYGEPSKTTSSGLELNYLFDNRQNPINPQNGAYLNIAFRQNEKFFGSNSNWSWFRADYRKYFKLNPEKNNNMLAIWAFGWFSNGDIPYLDMPSTAQDMFNNSGRGYVQGRFTGKNELYLEAEYRFGILNNGLLGGVLFANGESLSEFPSESFKSVAPSIGAGFRVKVNKHSNTNVCIDYAYGLRGSSNGFFLNLGEVF